MTVSTRLRIGRLAILLAACAVTLGVAEIAVRVLLPRPGFVPFPVAEVAGVMRPDPHLGYRYAPNLRRHVVTPDYEIDFETNALGMRDGPIGEIAAAGLRILAVGDSYTQGHGVSATDSWPTRLERLLPGARVYNGAVSGYGMRQFRLMAEELAPVVKPQLLIVGLYGQGYTRVEDSYVLAGDRAGIITRSMSGRVEVIEDGFLVPDFDTPILRRLGTWAQRNWHFAAHLMHLAGEAYGRARGGALPRGGGGVTDLERRMQPMLEELRLCREFARRRGIEMVTLLVNPQEKSGEYDPIQRAYNDVIVAFARREGIRVVDPLAELEDRADGKPRFRFAGDKHWSPAAHAVAAELLAAYLRREGLLEARAAPQAAR